VKRSLPRRYRPAFGRKEEVPSRWVSRRRPGKGRGILERVLRNLPAYGARNVEKVAAGTGEALPGPVACELLLERLVL
jgi:hypothetical protein